MIKAYKEKCSNTSVTVVTAFFDVVQAGGEIMSDKGFPHINSGLEGEQAVLAMPSSEADTVPQR